MAGSSSEAGKETDRPTSSSGDENIAEKAGSIHSRSRGSRTAGEEDESSDDVDRIEVAKEAQLGAEEGDTTTKPNKPELDRMRSYATATSATTTATSAAVQVPERKPWYKQPNPLRWGKIPPVPETRKISPEYKANFFSSLIFHWMAPLMSVSSSDSDMTGDANLLTMTRRVTNDSSNSRTSTR